MGLAVLAVLSQLSFPEARPPKPLVPALREAALSSAESSEQRFHVPGKMEEADRLRLMRTRGAAPAASTTNASAVASAKTASCRKQAPQAWNKNVLEQVTRIREVLSVSPGQARELCCDWMGEQDEEVATTPSTGASLGPLDFVNVIAFSAVGLEYAPQTRFRTLFLNELGVSSFLAHYDAGEAWYKSQGWYAALVKYSSAYKTTSKTRYLANALKNRYEDVFIFFSHVWLLDEDVVLPPPHHVSGFVSIAVRLQAALAQPTLDAATWSVVKPNAECAVRETDIVETQMPLIRTQAAVDVFSRLLPEQLSSDWGVDSTWCRYLEAKYGRAQPACVVANSGGFRKTRPRLDQLLAARGGDLHARGAPVSRGRDAHHALRRPGRPARQDRGGLGPAHDGRAALAAYRRPGQPHVRLHLLLHLRLPLRLPLRRRPRRRPGRRPRRRPRRRQADAP